MDIIEIEILEDGKIKIVTGKVSGANHLSAETFVRSAAMEAGGEVDRKRRTGAAHSHHHHHGEHTHEH